MFTRKQYLAGECNLEEYYLPIAQESGISFKDSGMLPRIKEALGLDDEHLNTIPLREWDMHAVCIYRCIGEALKKRGDCVSLAGAVCILKAAARHAAKEEGKSDSNPETGTQYGDLL